MKFSDKKNSKDRKKHVLLVIDSQLDVGQRITFMLQKKIKKSHLVLDGLRALDVARKYPVDFIFLELDLPLLDGLHVCQMLRKQPTLQHTPIFLMEETRPGEALLQKIKDVGGDGFLQKPIKRHSLQRIFRQKICQQSRDYSSFVVI